MLLSLRKNDLTSLFKEVRVFKVNTSSIPEDIFAVMDPVIIQYYFEAVMITAF